MHRVYLTENPEPREKCLKDSSAVNFLQGPEIKQQHTNIGEENKNRQKINIGNY